DNAEFGCNILQPEILMVGPPTIDDGSTAIRSFYQTEAGDATTLWAEAADPPTHHRVVFPPLDRLESAFLIYGPWAAEMARIAPLGLVVRIPLDPQSTAGGSVRDNAIEQCRGDPVPSKRRGGNEAQDSDHASRLGSVGIEKPVEAVV